MLTSEVGALSHRCRHRRTSITSPTRHGRLRAAAPVTVEALASMLRAAWRADTAWIDDWDPRNPARGQCGSSALVLHDLRGGTLMRGLVQETPAKPSAKLTVHYWNVIDIGQVDLTREQFPEGARIVLGEPVERDDLLTSRWLTDRYEALRDRVDLASRISVTSIASTEQRAPA